jgi:uncharacterized membrane protein
MIQENTSTLNGNVGAFERVASTVAGGLLLTRGLRKPSAGRLIAAVAGADLIYRGVTGRCALYSTLGVNTAARNKSGSEIAANAPEVKRSITIGKPPEELYAFWRNPENLQKIVAPFAEVMPQREGILHWRVRGPLKQVFEWDSQHTEEQANRALAWQTLPGSTLVNHGRITFEPGPDGTGTEVTLQMQFEPPLGSIGAGLVNVLHKIPRALAGQTLRRFKSLVETGEIPTLAENPSGRGAWDFA